jgi:hypothetical protein
MAKDSADDLKGIVSAARQHRLEAADIALLREKIAEIRALELEGRILRTAQRNLAVADTQLRDLQAHAEQGTIDEAAFAALPAHLRKQVLTRLDNSVARMRKALDAAQADRYEAPSFRCMEDYETCKARSPGSPIWCHIAMIVCQIRALKPVISAARGSRRQPR